jgi:hypothetical protein
VRSLYSTTIELLSNGHWRVSIKDETGAWDILTAPTLIMAIGTSKESILKREERKTVNDKKEVNG